MRCANCPVAESRLTCHRTYGGKGFRGQQTGIEDARAIQWRVTEADRIRRFITAIEVLKDKVTCAARRFQIALFLKGARSFNQCPGGKCSGHDSGRAARCKEGATLPVKVVPPTRCAAL